MLVAMPRSEALAAERACKKGGLSHTVCTASSVCMAGMESLAEVAMAGTGWNSDGGGLVSAALMFWTPAGTPPSGTVSLPEVKLHGAFWHTPLQL